jgi:hypothetical protein
MMNSLDLRFQHQLLGKMLLHERLTRRQIGEAFGVTLAAVTHHTQWLTEHDLVQADLVRLPGVKRPVEMLRLNAARCRGLAVLLEPSGARGEIVDAAGEAVGAVTAPAARPCQREVLGALQKVVEQARRQLRNSGQELDGVVIGVHGYLEPSNGIIFGVHGVAAWEPCLPGEVLSALRGLHITTATRVQTARPFGAAARRPSHRLHRAQPAFAGDRHARTRRARVGPLRHRLQRGARNGRGRCARLFLRAHWLPR